MSSILWTHPQTLHDYWSSDAGTDFLDKWFSIPKISHYFRRTPLPVTMADIDGWHARDLIAPLFFNDNTELHILLRKCLIAQSASPPPPCFQSAIYTKSEESSVQLCCSVLSYPPLPYWLLPLIFY